MELDELRKQLDGIDKRLLDAFFERMKVVADIAEVKREQGLALYHPAREREILARVGAEGGEELGSYARVLFTTLMSLSRTYQARLGGAGSETLGALDAAMQQRPMPRGGRIACQGVEGAYSQEACLKMFPDADILFFKNFDAVFAAVESGLCQFGVLPAENSTHGTVGEVYDLMLEHNFSIVKSMKLKISHALLAKRGTSMKDIKEVYSHEQALGQCAKYLDGKGFATHAVENTAVAAKLVAESERSDIAAIASKSCADLYDLEVVGEDIQDAGANFTRFICIAPELRVYPGASKISFVCTLPHTPGSLHSLISRFAALGLNLTKLESRPIPGRDFEFRFYFDMEADLLDPQVRSLVAELETLTEQFRFLGAYTEA